MGKRALTTEFKVREIDTSHYDIDEELNKEAEDGWEPYLMQAVWKGEAFQRWAYIYTFRRRKAEHS